MHIVNLAYGEDAIERFTAKLDRLKDLDVTVKPVEDHVLRVDFDSGSVFCAFDDQGTVTFYSYSGRGTLGRLARAMPAACLEIGVKRMRCTPDRHASRLAFRRIGFQGAGDVMTCSCDRMATYARWRNGSGEEPSWHKRLSEERAE